MSRETKYGVVGAAIAVIGMALIVTLFFLLPVVALQVVGVSVPLVALACAGWAAGKDFYYDHCV